MSRRLKKIPLKYARTSWIACYDDVICKQTQNKKFSFRKSLLQKILDCLKNRAYNIQTNPKNGFFTVWFRNIWCARRISPIKSKVWFKKYVSKILTKILFSKKLYNLIQNLTFFWIKYLIKIWYVKFQQNQKTFY